MIDIVAASNLPRRIPEHLENLLSERDQLLNRLPVESIFEVFEAKEAAFFVDRTMALSAASSGVPTSILAKVFSFSFPILLLATIPLLLFSWQVAALALGGAVIAFRAGRHFTVEDVRNFALQDSRALEKLMEHGVVYFKMVAYVPGLSHLSRPETHPISPICPKLTRLLQYLRHISRKKRESTVLETIHLCRKN